MCITGLVYHGVNFYYSFRNKRSAPPIVCVFVCSRSLRNT